LIRNDFARTEAGARDRVPSGAETPNTGYRSVAELEAENAALRRALADARAEAKLAATRHGTDLSREKAGRATEAAEAREASAGAEAHHGREMAASRGDFAASQDSNAALRRANLALTESRAALRESQERLRLILDSTADYAIFSMDTERRIASWNAGAERLLGWSEGEILGEPADVVFTPEDREAGVPEQEGEGALRHGRALDERWHQRKDGSRFWANGLMLPLRDPKDDATDPPHGLLKIMRDETGKRRTEEALREGEARWRGLFERMHEGFALCEMVYGPDGGAVDYRHLELNAAWGRLTGVPNEAVQGRLVSEAIPGIEPFWLETYARVVETGEPAHFEHHLAVYGRWFEVLAYRTEPGRFAAVFLNVTERKAAEARQAALIELGDRLRDLRDPGEIAATAVEVTGRALGGTRAGCGIVDMARGVFRIERDWTDGGAPSIAGELRIADFWADLAAEFGPGEVVAVEDAGRDPRTADRAVAYAAAGVRAFLDVPLVEAGRVRAILFVHDAVPRAWTAEEVAFVRGVADRAWAAADRARAEAALRGSEARFRALTRASSDVLYRMSPDWSEMRQLSGGGFIADTSIPTRDWLEAYIPPEDRPLVRAAIDEAVRTGGAYDLEHRVRRPGGGLGWAHSRAVPVLGADGGVAEWFGAASDVTARREAEEALRESEERRRAALDAARLGTWEWDVATGAVAMDGRSREIFGFAPGEGGRGEEVFGRIHPDDRARVLAEALAATDARRRLETEYRVSLPGGAVRAVGSLGDALPGAGSARMAGVFADITDRKLAEERRALLVNELNHRVKNTLAVVQSLAAQTARGAADLPAFSAAFQARLIALARAHDLLTRENWEGAPLGDVARAALAPGGEGRVDFRGCGGDGSGAGPLLAPPQALALALALHELNTNALKHGALSVSGGRVSVRCVADPGEGAHAVEWLERGGPPIAAPPTRRGFGLRLLERGLAAQAGMAAELRFEPEGLRCALRLPVAC